MYSQAYVIKQVKSASATWFERGRQWCIEKVSAGSGWAREKSKGSGQNAQHGWKGGRSWVRLDRAR